MFNPCVDYCYARYGKEYTSNCDTKCEFAKVSKENNELKAQLARRDNILTSINSKQYLYKCPSCGHTTLSKFIAINPVMCPRCEVALEAVVALGVVE